MNNIKKIQWNVKILLICQLTDIMLFCLFLFIGMDHLLWEDFKQNDMSYSEEKNKEEKYYSIIACHHLQQGEDQKPINKSMVKILKIPQVHFHQRLWSARVESVHKNLS